MTEVNRAKKNKKRHSELLQICRPNQFSAQIRILCGKNDESQTDVSSGPGQKYVSSPLTPLARCNNNVSMRAKQWDWISKGDNVRGQSTLCHTHVSLAGVSHVAVLCPQLLQWLTPILQAKWESNLARSGLAMLGERSQQRPSPARCAGYTSALLE